MSKPTTRQRMERLVKCETTGICTCSREQAVDLLLKEHRRLRAKVRKQLELNKHGDLFRFRGTEVAGYYRALQDVLDILK